MTLRNLAWFPAWALLQFPGPAWAADAGASALFGTHCAPCHGGDGRARTPIGRKIGVKDLTQSKATDADMERQIRHGQRDSRGDRMPAFQGKLTDSEITALLAYTKALRR